MPQYTAARKDSVWGLLFWLSLAAVCGGIFFFGYLPARQERAEQLRALDRLEETNQKLKQEIQNTSLVNDALRQGDEGVVQQFLHNHGYVQEGRGVVLPAPQVEPPGK